jgi:arginase
VAFELFGVPFSSMHPPGGIARAIGVLREHGLAERLAGAGDVRDAGDLALAAGEGERGPSGLLNEPALLELTEASRDAVLGAHERGRTPLLVGGDCPVLLGALAAGRDLRGSCGLCHVDGHEDAWPPPSSPTGEASDSEIAIALGLVARLPGALEALVPLVAPDAIAMLGPRDAEEIAGGDVESLRGMVAWFGDDEAIRAAGPRAAARAALGAIGEAAPAFWLHVDLDVLATDEMPAVDYRQPGGLRWPELEAAAAEAIAAPECLGASIVIYNPDLDEGAASAERIVEFVAGLARQRT